VHSQVIKVYQLLAQSRWFSPGTLASSTTKTGRNDIAEILLKVALSTKHLNHIGGIMVSMLASSAIDLGFGPKLGR
jgi:hypothetical protein